jgi:hypothetical protein
MTSWGPVSSVFLTSGAWQVGEESVEEELGWSFLSLSASGPPRVLGSWVLAPEWREPGPVSHPSQRQAGWHRDWEILSFFPLPFPYHVCLCPIHSPPRQSEFSNI